MALRDDDVALGWAQVNDILNRVVNGLGDFDLGPDRRVAVLAENSVETVLAHLGGLLAGASTVPVNFHLNADEVAYILEDSGAQVLFVGPETAATGLEAARRVGRAGRHRMAARRTSTDVRSWEDWLAAASPAEPSADVEPRPEPDVHVGHDRPPEGRRAAADDVRRRRHDDRARRRAGARARSPRSAPTSSSGRCTTPVRCRACACSPPASRSSCSAGSTPRTCCGRSTPTGPRRR